MTRSEHLSDDDLLQYSRQIMLPQIDIRGQQALLASKIVVLGAGGLGCPALMYLATSGVGELIVVDPDIIERSNIQRQILYNPADIGRPKAQVAAEKLQRYSEHIKITAINAVPNPEWLADMAKQADAVLDGTDNFASRYRHNEVCVKSKTPLVSGAVIRFEGQVTSFDHRLPDSPCYHCLYPQAGDPPLTCSENGVLGPVAGMIGAMMATETIKLLLNIGQGVTGRLLILDALNAEWRSVRLRKDRACPVCVNG